MDKIVRCIGNKEKESIFCGDVQAEYGGEIASLAQILKKYALMGPKWNNKNLLHVYLHATQEVKQVHVCPCEKHAKEYGHSEKDTFFFFMQSEQKSEMVVGINDAFVLGENVSKESFVKGLNHVRVHNQHSLFVPTGTVYGLPSYTQLLIIESDGMEYDIDYCNDYVYTNHAMQIKQIMYDGYDKDVVTNIRWHPHECCVLANTRSFRVQKIVMEHNDIPMILNKYNKQPRIIFVVDGNIKINNQFVSENECVLVPYAGTYHVNATKESQFIFVDSFC